MPLYDFTCDNCGTTKEKIFRIKECPKTILCSGCGKRARKVIATGHGGIQTDNDVAWLPSAIKTLQPSHERPITTRGEYKTYLKNNGITPVE